MQQSRIFCGSLLALSLLLAACVDSSRDLPADLAWPRMQSPQAPPHLPPLPLPLELSGQLPRREGSAFTEADLILEGESFLPALPNQRVTAEGAAARYRPDFNEITSFNPARLSFAMYTCLAQGYDRGPTISLSWAQLPAVPGDVYLGLANWQTNRWDWFQGNASNLFNFLDSAPYFELNDTMLITVMQIGEDENLLDRLHVGNTAPSASFTASATLGIVPLDLHFDASASVDAEGSIVSYDWDPDGDGIFDISSGSSPLLDKSYLQPGEIAVGLRVTDEDRLFSVAEKDLHLSDGFQATYGMPQFDEQGNAVVTCPDGSLLVFGEEGPQSGSIDGLVAKLNLQGGLVFAKSCGGSDIDSLKGASLGSDGFVYACGVTKTAGGGLDGLLQKWTQDGELIWSKSCGQEEAEELTAVAAVDGVVYACGFSTVLDVKHALLVAFSDAGEPIWAIRNFDITKSEFKDLMIRSEFQSHSIRCCGLFDTGANEVDMLYAVFDAAGACSDSQRAGLFGAGNELEGDSICQIGGPFSGRFVIAGFFSNQTGSDTVVSEVGGSGQSLGQPDNDTMTAVDIIRLSGGGMRLLTAIDGVNNQGLMLAELDTNIDMSSAFNLHHREFACTPRSMDNFGEGSAISGDLNQRLLEGKEISPTQGNPGLSWVSQPLALAQIVLAVTEQPTATTDLTSQFGLNRVETDRDLFVTVFPFK